MFAHHKRADRANVDDTKLAKLLGEQRGLASISSTDIHRAKKNDTGHKKSRK